MWCKAGCLPSSLLLFICIMSWAHILQSRCWEFLWNLGKIYFETWWVVLFISLSPVYPRGSPCYLCHLLEQKDLGFHNLWFDLCPLTVSPYPTFQDQRFGFCSFSEMGVHLFWRIKCFGSWNTHVFFLSLKLLLFRHIVFPRSQNTNGIKNNHLNASHGLPLSIPGISMHSVGSTCIFPIFLGSLVETEREKIDIGPQEIQWQALVPWITSWGLEPSNGLSPSMPKNTWPILSSNVQCQMSRYVS